MLAGAGLEWGEGHSEFSAAVTYGLSTVSGELGMVWEAQSLLCRPSLCLKLPQFVIGVH